MVNLGVYEGMNMDGGGSTPMVVEGKIVNRPAASTAGRSISGRSQ